MKKGAIEETETWTTIIANVISIGSWLFSFLTAVALNIQPEPVSLVGIVEINGYYKLLFLASIFLGYIHLLNVLWRRGKKTEGSLGEFIYNSVIRLKRPLVAVGFLLLMGTCVIVGFSETPELAGIVGGFSLLIVFVAGTMWASGVSQGWVSIRLRYDTEYRQKWLKRIRRRLHERGYVQTSDFKGMGFSYEEVNKALKMFFEIYEFQQDLALNCYALSCELGFRSRMSK